MDRFLVTRPRKRPVDLETVDTDPTPTTTKSGSNDCHDSIEIEEIDLPTKQPAEPLNKKIKVHNQRYKAIYSERWSFIKPVDDDDESVECTLCHSIIKINHGGANDIEKHFEKKKHQRAVQLAEQKNTMLQFCRPGSSDNLKREEQGRQVTLAESLFTKFLIEHNVALSASEHAGPLFRRMFPDSKVAKEYSSARTKTTAIVNSFGDNSADRLTEVLRVSPFSLATDGSNDSGAETLYPIVIRYFNVELQEIATELLTLAACSTTSTGENIFNLLDKELKSRGIPWSNCLSFGCDNANVMVGCHKGVAGFIKRENANVKIQGCPCHLIHIAAKSASKQLSIDVEQILIDIYFFFDKSTKRQQEFRALCVETGDVVAKIIKHGATRWLSLGNCNNRLLSQWTSLSQYFLNEKGQGERILRLKIFFSNPLSKAYCLFLKKTLPLFTDLNEFLQREEPLLHIMQEKILDLLTSLAVCFIKTEAISGCSSLLTLDYSKRENQKHRQDVMIGSDARDYLAQLKSDSKVTRDQESAFFSDVRHFFSEACGYIIKKLPLESELLAHCGVLNVRERKNFSFHCEVLGQGFSFPHGRPFPGPT